MKSRVSIEPGNIVLVIIAKRFENAWTTSDGIATLLILFLYSRHNVSEFSDESIFERMPCGYASKTNVLTFDFPKPWEEALAFNSLTWDSPQTGGTECQCGLAFIVLPVSLVGPTHLAHLLPARERNPRSGQLTHELANNYDIRWFGLTFSRSLRLKYLKLTSSLSGLFSTLERSHGRHEPIGMHYLFSKLKYPGCVFVNRSLGSYFSLTAFNLA